jgi:hypothetical protein
MLIKIDQAEKGLQLLDARGLGGRGWPRHCCGEELFPSLKQNGPGNQ